MTRAMLPLPCHDIKWLGGHRRCIKKSRWDKGQCNIVCIISGGRLWFSCLICVFTVYDLSFFSGVHYSYWLVYILHGTTQGRMMITYSKEESTLPKLMMKCRLVSLDMHDSICFQVICKSFWVLVWHALFVHLAARVECKFEQNDLTWT